MRSLLFIVLACACATAPGPKRPDVSHRVPVNQTLPPELEAAAKTSQAAGKQARREGEVEWR